jgi:hypothetical protein
MTNRRGGLSAGFVIAHLSFVIGHFEEPIDSFALLFDYRIDDQGNETRALLESLKKGGPEEVRKSFREMVEVFRLRHLQHVQSVESKREACAEENRPPGEATA